MVLSIARPADIAIKITYAKSGAADFGCVFNTPVSEFSWLKHVNNNTQFVHPCDLDVSPMLVSRYMFYRNQVKQLSKDGIVPGYATELMNLLESQILDAVHDFIEPKRYIATEY